MRAHLPATPAIACQPTHGSGTRVKLPVMSKTVLQQDLSLQAMLQHSGPILLMLGLAALLQALAPGAYHDVAQEDGPVEWLTFWAFALAGGLTLTLPAREGSGRIGRAFYLLFALGCFLVALEEISWGQRLLGYRPPEIFLRENFQQELNLHNLADTATRKLLLLGLLISFGLIYPLLSHLPAAAGLLTRAGIPGLPLGFLPGFAALTVVYLAYPWRYTGEWVELGAGIGFVQAALFYRRWPQGWRWLLAGALLLAGIFTAALQARLTDPARQELALLESQALARDFTTRRYRSRCGVHKRVYTSVVEYRGAPYGLTALAELPLPHPEDEERRRYYLDPWNLPYWVRHACSRDRQESTLMIYSFGPNRRRDSRGNELNGDDVGTVVARRRRR